MKQATLNKDGRPKLWDVIAKNYELVEGAQMSNSLIILMALAENEKPMSTTDVSQHIAKMSKGQIYKISATMKETLENRLRPAGYVTGHDIATEEGAKRRSVRVTNYEITEKGKRLLKAWEGFVKALE